jgi:cellulose synthase/poly-beta-1,6-N-acetylglucosamine synthase-like glycosyltransferase
MNTEQHIETRIWDYIDGNLSVEENSFVENLVQTNQEWREKYSELLQVHGLMQESLELEAPSMSFTRNVMEEISRLQITPASKKYLNQKIIWGLGGFFILTLLGFFIYAFSQATWTSDAKSVLPFNIESMNYEKLFNSAYTNVFLMINTVLGLMLLDMYLGAKKKKLREAR